MDSRRRIPRREPAAVASSEAVCLDSLLDRAGAYCSRRVRADRVGDNVRLDRQRARLQGG